MNKFILLFLIAFILSLGAVYAHEGMDNLPEGVHKIQEYEEQRALSINLLIAFLAGVISFISPCGFALLPAYFSFLFRERKRAVFMTASFGLGLFSAFAVLGFLAGIIFNFFFSQKQVLASISGVAIAIFGLLLLFNISISVLNFQVKHTPNKSFWSIFLLGLFFGFGWSPCLGPVLGSIIFLSAQMKAVFNGVVFMGAFALGVSLPLMIFSYFSDKLDLQRFASKGHISLTLFGREIITHVYNIIGGLFLIILGTVMALYGSTSFFEQKITEYTSWTMVALIDFNNKLISSQFFGSLTARIIGAVVFVGAIGIISYELRKALMRP